MEVEALDRGDNAGLCVCVTVDRGEGRGEMRSWGLSSG